MKIGFERKLLKLDDFEFDNVQVKSIGSKILLAGDDTTVHNFLQEYVGAVMNDLGNVKNIHLRRNLNVYAIPSGQNTLCQYLAERDPIYRQNVF